MTKPEEVKNSGIVGRRIESGHVTLSTGSVRYEWEAFYDDRVETDLSVDFIGDEGNAKVLRTMPKVLAPIAEKDFAESNASSPLAGWAGLRRKTIRTFSVIRTPVTEEERPENPNPHHCEIVRTNHRTKQAARSLAFELRTNAEEDNLFVPLPNSSSAIS